MSRLLSSLRGHADAALSLPLRFLPQVTHKTSSKFSSSVCNEPNGDHKVEPGMVYNQRYKTIRQLGRGKYSTVWLVHDLRKHQAAAMKVLARTLGDEKVGWDELGVLKSLRDHNPQSRGYPHVCQILDDFVYDGPNGSHTCLVLELLCPSVLDVYRGFAGPMPLPLVRRISKHILYALEYLHECGFVHTDIKGDNILLASQRYDLDQPFIIPKGDELMSSQFKLADFGAANKMSNRFAQVIQPVALRSPEVIIGAEWNTKTDIWNFGCLIYEFIRGAQLFDPYWNNDQSGLNPPQTHLAQIVGLLGQFPVSLLDRSKNAHRYFSDQGRILHGDGKYFITLRDLLQRANLSADEIPATIDFLSQMLRVDPEERWSATELLDHPWLKHVH